MIDFIQPILIILAVLIGGGAIVYFYFSADIFMDILKRPLKMISVGMLAIDIGIVLIAFTAYESIQGVNIDFFGVPLSACFYVLYFLGSAMVIFGSRKFTRQPS
jgi:uncharacterized membrane protein